MTESQKIILLINGPNLDRLGEREPSIYGTDTLNDIESAVILQAKGFSIDVLCYQSDSEDNIIDFIQTNAERASGIIINPAAFSHHSIALAHILRLIECPKVEVHITNLYAREKYRHESVTATACDGVIMGLGKSGYLAALNYIIDNM